DLRGRGDRAPGGERHYGRQRRRAYAGGGAADRPSGHGMGADGRDRRGRGHGEAGIGRYCRSASGVRLDRRRPPMTEAAAGRDLVALPRAAVLMLWTAAYLRGDLGPDDASQMSYGVG